jgi:cyclopropane fatty-acyl-phospholipid synthase-like methyltransferase
MSAREDETTPMHGESARDAANRAYSAAQDRMALLPNYYRWIAAHFRDHVKGTVLELGAGAGMVVQHYLDRADRVVAVDVDPELLRRLEARHSDGRVRGVQADLRGDWRELDGVTADVVVALDVLEHFEDDAAFVAKAKRHLAPRGRLVLKVPAQSKLFGPMDEASGHFRRYDEAPLVELMRRAGFETVALRHMNPAGAWGYRMKRERSTNFSKSIAPGKLRVVNALMPLLATLDHVPGLKGLSLIGVFRRVDDSVA